MANCAIVKCDMDFTSGIDHCITNAKMMFGTKLMVKGEEDNEGKADEHLHLEHDENHGPTLHHKSPSGRELVKSMSTKISTSASHFTPMGGGESTV